VGPGSTWEEGSNAVGGGNKGVVVVVKVTMPCRGVRGLARKSANLPRMRLKFATRGRTSLPNWCGAVHKPVSHKMFRTGRSLRSSRAAAYGL